MSNRELALDLIRKLPEDMPLLDMAREIEFVAGVREGLAQTDRGEVLSLEELDQLVRQWNTESS